MSKRVLLACVLLLAIGIALLPLVGGGVLWTHPLWLAVARPDLTTGWLLLLVAAGGFVASVALTGLVRSIALRSNLLATPNARSSHTTPTPTGAGVAVLVAIALGLIGGVLTGVIRTTDAVTLGAGMVVLGVVGWMDDRRGVPPRWRLAIHALTAAWTLERIGGFPNLTLGDSVAEIGMAGWALGVIGILWSISLFNFMDGIDGLAGSQALLIFGAAAAGLWLRGEHSLAAVAAVVAAASAGFLGWNWPPAKIFLGDVGSGALGYLVAAIAIASENRAAMPLLAFAILGGVFVADASITLIRRVRRGHSASEAHRDHAYQRLSRAWSSHRAVSIAAALVSLFLAALALATTARTAILLPALGIAAVVLGALYFAAERLAPMPSAGPGAPPT